jgi:hypothetical protein
MTNNVRIVFWNGENNVDIENISVVGVSAALKFYTACYDDLAAFSNEEHRRCNEDKIRDMIMKHARTFFVNSDIIVVEFID